jgi:hypothetical protein
MYRKSDPAHVYVIVRADLPHPILSVQASHAAIAATFAFGEPHKTHPNLVLCSVPDEPALAAVFNRLKEFGVPCCSWSEDDMGGSLTAVATAPLRGDERKPLRRLDLLK